MTRYRSVVVPMLAALVLAAPATLFAATQCRVVGTVSDGEGKPLQGVKITITTPAITTYKLSLETKAKGDWGTIINDARTNGALYEGLYYWILEPAALLLVTSLAFALLGFALDRVFNPRLRDV